MNKNKDLNIFVIYFDEPLYTNKPLAQIIEKYSKQIKGYSIVKSYPPNKNFIWFIKKTLGFMGVINFFRLGFLMLGKKIIGLLGTEKHNPLEKIFKEKNISKYKIKSVNTDNFVALMKKLDIDIILSLSPEIYKKNAINAPNIGILNKHCALLPKYRGVYPIFWALKNNEEFIGLTIHFIDESIDTGAIVSQKKVKVEKKDSMHSLYKKTYNILPELFDEAIEKIKKKEFNQNPPLNNNKYYSFPKKDDRKDFLDKGKRFM